MFYCIVIERRGTFCLLIKQFFNKMALTGKENEMNTLVLFLGSICLTYLIVRLFHTKEFDNFFKRREYISDVVWKIGESLHDGTTFRNFFFREISENFEDEEMVSKTFFCKR